MKINSITSSYYVQNYRSNKYTASGQNKVKSGSDMVSFSDEAISFSKTLSDMKSKIEIRTDEEKTRIRDIQTRIKLGQYNISSDLVAEKILHHFKY